MAFAGAHLYTARPDYAVDFTATDDAAAVRAIDHGDLDERLRDALVQAAVAIVHVSACPCGQGDDEEFID